jgi:hypothetical protein
VIPLFKTHASIGKSILKNSDILSFQKDRELKQVVMVEDTFYGFREINQKLIEANSQLIFGIRLSVVENKTDELSSKLIYFAKNNEGAKQIKNLYTKANCSDSGNLVLNELKQEEYSEIKVGVPFYDSFIYQNIFNFGLCDVNIKRFDHFFFEEKNDHPFDAIISQQLKSFCKKTVLSKSIYYKNRQDVEAFQFYKAVCNRSGGRSPNFGNPNIEHFCSPEFCWESYLENK